MKRFTEKELQNYLKSEVIRIGLSEGWITNDLDKSSETEKLTLETENVQIEEVKLLAEEIKRMKELVDFRSPLLKKD